MSRWKVDLRVAGMTTPTAARFRIILQWLGATFALAILSTPIVDAQAAIGLSAVRAQAFFNETIDGFPPEQDDAFAQALAAGDFNGDGAQDLATGIPGDNGPSDLPLDSAGAVVVRWGVPGKGLSTTLAPSLLSLYAAGGPTQAHAGDLYGHALAAGDFNGDGRADLAVGIPWFSTTVGDDYDMGAVAIHYGEPGGIQLAAEHLLRSGTAGNVPIPTGSRTLFGWALAAGDFDGDGFADLAVGAPQNCCGSNGGGGVVVLHGGIGGLFPVVAYLIHQDDPQVPDVGEDPDDFGYSLAAGNFNGDFRLTGNGTFPIDDLAMSAPGEDGIGAVMVMLGSEFGLIFSNSAYLGAGDVGGVGEAGDRFGQSLVAGNFDGDVECLPFLFCTSIDDLAIGTPYADLGSSNEDIDAGEATVLYGVANGYFDLARTDHLTQGAIFGSTVFDQTGDLFGAALAAGDFDLDGRDDLAIGQPGEDVGGTDRGGVTILMGAVGGLYDRFRFLAAGINGVLPGPQEGSRMGFSLAVGDFEGNAHADLVIGIPHRDQAGMDNAGAESILYGAMFADGFVSGDGGYWSEYNP